ncbi:MAG: hypothetical protein H0V29_00130 [Thermoleophilaceae bacterium]|nr:hypothetical protein [Thermoleophilaceae bacterium]
MKKCLLLPLVLLAACGGGSGDTLAIDIEGGPRNEKYAIRVTGDGRASCDGNELQALLSQQVITSREIERGVREFAVDARSFITAEPGRRSYTLRTTDGTVRWTEGAPGLPAVLPKAQRLGFQLERTLCRGEPAPKAL